MKIGCPTKYYSTSIQTVPFSLHTRDRFWHSPIVVSCQPHQDFGPIGVLPAQNVESK
jgi:hypothetical protein